MFRYVAQRDDKFRCSGIDVDCLLMNLCDSFLPEPFSKHKPVKKSANNDDSDIWSDVDEELLCSIAMNVESQNQ